MQYPQRERFLACLEPQEKHLKNRLPLQWFGLDRTWTQNDDFALLNRVDVWKYAFYCICLFYLW